MGGAKLFVIPGSHACRTGMLLLEHKGIAYERVELLTGLHPLSVRLRGFPGSRSPIRAVDGRTHRMLALMDRAGTVPALRVGGQRVQTNRAIARFLERVQPDPPLFPGEPALRTQVEEAERWGDEVLQMLARRIVLRSAAQDLDSLQARGGEGRLGALLDRRAPMRLLASHMAALTFRASRRGQAELLAALTPAFDRIDAWIAAGVLGGEQLNAADLMIAPSLALLSYRPDLDAEIAARPAGALLDRVLPQPVAPA
jgi:glutathione S-transferase